MNPKKKIVLASILSLSISSCASSQEIEGCALDFLVEKTRKEIIKSNSSDEKIVLYGFFNLTITNDSVDSKEIAAWYTGNDEVTGFVKNSRVAIFDYPSCEFEGVFREQ